MPLEVGTWSEEKIALHSFTTLPSFTSGQPFRRNGPIISYRSSDLNTEHYHLNLLGTNTDLAISPELGTRIQRAISPEIGTRTEQCHLNLLGTNTD